MKRRIISTVCLWSVVVIALAVLGPQAGVWLLAFLAVATQRELYRMLAKMGGAPMRTLGMLFGAAIVLGAYYIPTYVDKNQLYGGTDILILAVFVCCLASLFKANTVPYSKSLMPTLFGLVLVPFTQQFLISIFLLPKSDLFNLPIEKLEMQGMVLAVWLVAVAKFCDVGALLVGSAIGKHKFSPILSPKKTWEGVIGGIAISIGVGVGFVALFEDHLPGAFTMTKAAIIAGPIAIAGIASDLLESALKREASIKDSGTMIPGIGGAFDLSDSLILSAPLGYFLFRYLVF